MTEEQQPSWADEFDRKFTVNGNIVAGAFAETVPAIKDFIVSTLEAELKKNNAEWVKSIIQGLELQTVLRSCSCSCHDDMDSILKTVIATMTESKT